MKKRKNQDFAKAMKYYKLGAQNNDMLAQYRAGMLIYNIYLGRYTTLDKTSYLGLIPGINLISEPTRFVKKKFAKNKFVTTPEYKTMIVFFEQAAKQGHTESQKMLKDFGEKGWMINI